MSADQADVPTPREAAREQQQILRSLAGPDMDGPAQKPLKKPVSKLRRAIAALGWLGIAAPLFVCVAVVLQVGRVPQLSLMNYVPLYPLAVVPIVAALLTRLRFLALPLGVAVALWVLVLDGFGFGIGTINPPAGMRIRLLSYNIEDWHGTNKQGFYDLIDDRRPDLLALQEVWGPGDPNDHRWDPIRHYEWGKTDGRHVGLLADFKPVRYEKLDDFGNAVLVERTGRQFWIACVQFPRGIDAVRAWQFLPTESRLEQGRFAEYLKEWLVGKPDVIVVGDFNAVAHSWFLRSLDLRNPWISTGFGVGGTYKVETPVARIDHVLIKGRITPLFSDTLALDDFSNHRGLLFDFAIDEIPPQPLGTARPGPSDNETPP